MNKEIEEILKYLKNNTYIPDETKRKYKILHRDEVNLLLSYIEQLEKETQQLKKQKDELEKENNELQKAYELIDKSMYELMKQKDDVVEYIKNYDVFKEFSFPLMKKWEENQVKSSIDYQFKESIKKDLLRMLGEIDE